MANYTMELNDIINLGYEIFNFDYPFYTDDTKIKEQFEQYFISYFYFHEIGCETFSRWQWMLRNKLMTIMPYYSQLYQTQWDRVGANMMLSKNLVETTKRELSNVDDYISSSKDKLNSQQSHQSQSQSTHSEESQSTHSEESQSNHSEQSESNSTSSATSSASGNEESSNLSDGVLVADLSPENRTEMSKSTSSGSSDSTGTQSSESTSNQSSEGTSNQTSKQDGTDDQIIKSNESLENSSSRQNESQSKSNLIEEITFSSQGDIGVQTPAYAIREWRSVIININEMIMKDCESLFMKIY